MNLTEKFQNNWKHGIDCRIAAFRNSLACENVLLSNPMALGLSGSFVFCYNVGDRYIRSPFFAIVGLTDQSLEGLASRLNCHLMRGRATIEGDIVKQLQPYFEFGLPVHAGVKRFRLKQLYEEIDDRNTLVGEDNGFHFVTLTGFDERTGQFDMFDTDIMKLVKISKKDLEEIWFYDLLYQPERKDQFQSCDGQWFAVKVGRNDNQQIVYGSLNAIEKTLQNFFDSPMDDIFGINAVLKFKEDAKNWAGGTLDPNYLCGSLQLMQFMETPLSGGGFGRKLYGYYLREFAELIEDAALKEISVLFSETARQWKKFVMQLGQSYSYQQGNLTVDYKKIEETVENYAGVLADREIDQMAQLDGWYRPLKKFSFN